MSEEREEYKFDHFKNIDEVMHYFNYWYKEEDVYSINRYLSLKDFNYISNKYQELQKENKKQKEVIDKAVNDIQEIIDAVNKNTIIAMKQFNFKLEIIQDELSGSNDILKEVE